jgi:hypothetical protein
VREAITPPAVVSAVAGGLNLLFLATQAGFAHITEMGGRVGTMDCFTGGEGSYHSPCCSKCCCRRARSAVLGYTGRICPHHITGRKGGDNGLFHRW